MTYLRAQSAQPLPITSTFRMASSAEGDNAQVVSPAPCTLMSVSVYNTGPAGIRLGLFNQSSVPTEDDEAQWIIYLDGQNKTHESWPSGMMFNNGLAIDVMAEQEGVLVPGILEALNIGYRVLAQ